ncbi:MAG: hypothetical protein K9L30_16480 [Desulfobacterales bacterium]|nr:hypothetical protein [Desulfobacterales bacterium]
MNTSKLLTIAAMILVAITFTACGGGKYDDAKKVYNDHISAMEKFTAQMEDAESAESVAKAISNYTDAMEKLIPEIKKLNKKYPELTGKNVAPDELKTETEKMEALSGRLEPAMMKTMQYIMSPEVQQALENQGNVMSKMSE